MSIKRDDQRSNLFSYLFADISGGLISRNFDRLLPRWGIWGKSASTENVWWGCPARHIFDRKESYGRVMDKYEGEARKNKGKIQEKVSQMKNQGGAYLCKMRGLEG